MNKKTISLVEAVYHPHKNENVISLMKMTDGNWVGEALKANAEGKLKPIRVRGSNPVNVLQGILVHDGKEETLTV